MERGLLWLPLLALFVTLTGWGWRAYRRVETYRQWATDFDQAAYDPWLVLGLKGTLFTWGKPSSQGPQALQTIDLSTVTAIDLVTPTTQASPSLSLDQLPAGPLSLVLQPQALSLACQDPKVAIAWGRHLHRLITKMDAADS